MKCLSLESECIIKGGMGYFLRTTDACRVLSSDTLLEEVDGSVRKIGISVSSGCLIGCIYCFSNKYPRYRPLSQRELLEQVNYVLGQKGEIDQKVALKISLKQMGDPLLNKKPVLDSLQTFASDYPTAMLVVSTSAPKVENGFFKGLQNLQEHGANIRLQFSCHTTSDAERNILSPKLPMMSLAEIGEVANNWSGQRVTLNFVIIDGYTYDVKEIQKIFSPNKVFIKINYIDSNTITEKNNLFDVSTQKKNAFARALQQAGYNLAYRNA